MGEYANLQLREDMKRMFGYDPGPIEDEPRVRRQDKPVHPRVKCPHCDAHPKVRGLRDHIRDVHQIPYADQKVQP